ncbi:MAG: hypothetical protein A2275_06535 [Bacteroidetes bacterium RIFOXYA12_FULL_35_11]|nr:MAG: hypothetical protein A2275_06535 [Bacteroidetes bacterium RIFOXYA12_FULL_35_11]OFY95771.1 MAG: hypothetical protein A2491_09585 [Bacteroidetes bacterium RIFOXYC12_FULL_35_7]
MNLNDILKLLESHRSDKEKPGLIKSGQKKLQSWGISIQKLKDIGRQIGSNHKLASELWDTLIYDALVLSTIIDNPKEITREQVDMQIKDVDFWQLSTLFTNMVCKTNFAKEKAEEWTSSDDDVQRRCGYALLYHIARDDKKIEDAFFEKFLEIIKNKISSEANQVKEAMNKALLQIGQRSENLNKKALALSREIGNIEIASDSIHEEIPDVVKILSSKKVQENLRNDS